MILNGAENEKHTGMILIDLQKAFDSLYHIQNFIRQNEVCQFFKYNNKMVSFLPHKQSFFRFIEQ